MNAAVILFVGIVVLACGYLFYGRWLAKTWGIDPSRKTPAVEYQDGVDYVPSKAPVLMGHHFSSIAGGRPDYRTGPGSRLRMGAGDALDPDRRHFLRRRT